MKTQPTTKQIRKAALQINPNWTATQDFLSEWWCIRNNGKIVTDYFKTERQAWKSVTASYDLTLSNQLN